MPAKTAIVTGGGQGIGKAIARHLLHQGMAVVIAEQDGEAGRETEAEYRALGEIAFIATNVADEAAVRHTVRAAVDRYGGLDALVNNAAVLANRPLTELTVEEWDRVLAVNLTGPMLCAKYAAPHLAARRGAIVNIGSTRALMSEPDTEAYSASKGGLLALTHALAASLGPAVRVNCISPGWIEVSDWRKTARRSAPRLRPEDHAQHPAGRVGVPDDVAALVGYLLADTGGFITGANFVVDGGMTRKMIYL